jgi:2-polyprenyl-6-methoxyphenol hydroxylase-like FAD-dependent oxidoreductase
MSHCAHEHYNADPYVEPGFTRPAIQEELDAVIVGGGFGGLLAAARLQKAGSLTFALSRRPEILAGPGTGSVIPARPGDFLILVVPVRAQTLRALRSVPLAQCRRVEAQLFGCRNPIF